MSATLNERRTIACPRCGSAVRIPLFWIAGIEGIFRCKSCGLAFKTGYKAGAALSATGLVLSLCTVQLLVYLLGSYSLLLGLALIVPLWLFYGSTCASATCCTGSGGACAEIRTTSSVRHSIFRLFRP